MTESNSDALRITEIFHSLQGEAKTAGKPTVFVRLTGCPLRCQYCDTEYAFVGGDLLSLDAILQEVKRYQCSLVTVVVARPQLHLTWCVVELNQEPSLMQLNPASQVVKHC